MASSRSDFSMPWDPALNELVSQITIVKKGELRNIKGSLKRMQESAELMELSYSKVSLEEELKTTMAMNSLGESYKKYKKKWRTSFDLEDRKYIEEKCQNKHPLITFTTNTDTTSNQGAHSLNCLLDLNGNKLEPDFNCDPSYKNYILSKAIKYTESKAAEIPEGNMLNFNYLAF